MSCRLHRESCADGLAVLGAVLLGRTSLGSNSLRIEHAKFNDRPIATNINGVDVNVFLKPESSRYSQKLWKIFQHGSNAYLTVPYPERKALMVIQVPSSRQHEMAQVKSFMSTARQQGMKQDFSIISQSSPMSVSMPAPSAASARTLVVPEGPRSKTRSRSLPTPTPSYASTNQEEELMPTQGQSARDEELERLRKQVEELADRNRNVEGELQYVKGRMDATPAAPAPRSSRSRSVRSEDHGLRDQIDKLQRQIQKIAEPQPQPQPQQPQPQPAAPAQPVDNGCDVCECQGGGCCSQSPSGLSAAFHNVPANAYYGDPVMYPQIEPAVAPTAPVPVAGTECYHYHR